MSTGGNPLGEAAPGPGIPAGAPPILDAGLKGLCPQCGAKTLFAGTARFADTCSACGLDFTKFNVGDGPAAFLTLILGTVIVAGAIIVELKFSPPLWVQMLIWIPVAAAGVLLLLRLAKGALMAAEYRNRAREGRIDPTPGDARSDDAA
ncbi:MAG: DUF983 domain-containing protein [Sphingomonas bacterium]|nr:DUF983 domain-containing protein [Sphingomonas bacterium]